MKDWCGPRPIEERLAMIHQLAGKRRLPSHLAAEAWLQLRERVGDIVSEDEAQLLARSRPAPASCS